MAIKDEIGAFVATPCDEGRLAATQSQAKHNPGFRASSPDAALPPSTRPAPLPRSIAARLIKSWLQSRDHSTMPARPRMTAEQRKLEAAKATRHLGGYKAVWKTNLRAFLAAEPGTPARRGAALRLVQAQANIIGWSSR